MLSVVLVFVKFQWPLSQCYSALLTVGCLLEQSTRRQHTWMSSSLTIASVMMTLEVHSILLLMHSCSPL